MALRIGVLCGDLSTRGGGIPNAVVPLYRALCRDPAFDVTLLGRNGDLAEGNVANLTYRDVGGRGAFGYSAALGPMLAAGSFDLLHVHGLWTYASVVAAGWRQGLRVVSPHGMLDPWALARSRLKKTIGRVLFEGRHLSGAACMHALNAAERDAVRAWGYRGPVAVIPNGIEPPAAVTSAGDGGSARAPTLLFLGRIDPKKGVRELLEAWSILKRESRLQRWMLAIAGWGEAGYVAAMRQLADDLGLGDTVAFVGPQYGPDKAKTYAEADAFILPSHSEGMPMTVLEAWSFGLPVLMTSACHLDVGFERQAAVPVTTDPAALAAAIDAFIARPVAERQAMGASGRRLVAAEYTWQRASEALAAVYRWLMKEGPRPACVWDD